MADVTRIRTGIWLGGDVHKNIDVHTEDDMIMIEAQHGGTDDFEIFICPELFPEIRRCMDELEAEECRVIGAEGGGDRDDELGVGARIVASEVVHARGVLMSHYGPMYETEDISGWTAGQLADWLQSNWSWREADIGATECGLCGTVVELVRRRNGEHRSEAGAGQAAQGAAATGVRG